MFKRLRDYKGTYLGSGVLRKWRPAHIFATNSCIVAHYSIHWTSWILDMIPVNELFRLSGWLPSHGHLYRSMLASTRLCNISMPFDQNIYDGYSNTAHSNLWMEKCSDDESPSDTQNILHAGLWTLTCSMHPLGRAIDSVTQQIVDNCLGLHHSLLHIYNCEQIEFLRESLYNCIEHPYR